jgi:Na+-driven multidrug efflux pump
VPFLIIFPELPTADGTLLGTNGVWIAIAAADAIAFITSAIMLWQYYHGGESTHLKSQARAQSLPHRIAAFFNNRLTH